MVNVDFMLGQRRRQLTYINPALSILQRKQHWSTRAQCFPNGGPASQTMTNVKPILGQCVVLIETAQQ